MLYPTPRDLKLVKLEIGPVFLKILSTSHPNYLADPYSFKEDYRHKWYAHIALQSVMSFFFLELLIAMTSNLGG